MPYVRHPSYKSWWHMMQRCYNETCNVYQHYGARGIQVCKRWHLFAKFAEDMGEKPPGRKWSLERLNNTKGYSRKNCKWATQAEQTRNTRRNVKINGICSVDHSAALGGSRALVCDRIKVLGWSRQKAVSAPLNPKPRQYATYNGTTDTLTGWARRLGIERTTMRRSVKSVGMLSSIKKFHTGDSHALH